MAKKIVVETRHFSGEEVENMIWSGVSEEEIHRGDWDTQMRTVALADDGKYYELLWSCGNTESQPNDYPAQTAKEVFEVVKLQIPRMERVWQTADEKAEKTTSVNFDRESLEAVSLITDGVDEALQTIMEYDLSEMQSFLDKIAPAMVEKKVEAFYESSKAFLAAIADLQGK